MLNIGFTELLIFGVIALLVLGPDKLPEAVRYVFKWYKKIKHMISNIQTDLDRELHLSELREQMESELQRMQALEAKVQAKMDQFEHQIQTDLTDKKADRTLHSKHIYLPVKSTIYSIYLPQKLNIEMPIQAQQNSEMKVAI